MTAERSTFRYVVGILCLLGGFASLIGLYIAEVPEGNREPLLLAIGIVLGWGSTVVNGEWGSSPGGRMAAEAGAKIAGKTADEPVQALITNPPSDPVPIDLPAPDYGKEPDAAELAQQLKDADK